MTLYDFLNCDIIFSQNARRINMDFFKTYSLKWMQVKNADDNACDECKQKHNRIVEVVNVLKMLTASALFHPYCRCTLEQITKAIAGTIDKRGTDGADYWILKYGKLPERYITRTEAEALGYTRSQANLHKVAPTRVFGGGIFTNQKKGFTGSTGTDMV